MVKYLHISLAPTMVSVRMDVNVEPRLGTKYLAEQVPQVFVNPCLFPARGGDFRSMRRPDHALNQCMDCTVLGAGRSQSLAGSRSPARSAARGIQSWTAPIPGGDHPMNAKRT